MIRRFPATVLPGAPARGCCTGTLPGLPQCQHGRAERRRQQRIQLVVGGQWLECCVAGVPSDVGRSGLHEQPGQRPSGAVPPSIYRHPVLNKYSPAFRLNTITQGNGAFPEWRVLRVRARVSDKFSSRLTLSPFPSGWELVIYGADGSAVRWFISARH